MDRSTTLGTESSSRCIPSGWLKPWSLGWSMWEERARATECQADKSAVATVSKTKELKKRHGQYADGESFRQL